MFIYFLSDLNKKTKIFQLIATNWSKMLIVGLSRIKNFCLSSMKNFPRNISVNLHYFRVFRASKISSVEVTNCTRERTAAFSKTLVVLRFCDLLEKFIR